VKVHYAACPPEVRRRRLAERGEARDLAKLREWEQYVGYYEESPPACDHVWVDGTNLSPQA